MAVRRAMHGLLFSRRQMGIVGEMMNEAVEAATDNNELEEETDDEVEKVLREIFAGKVNQLPTAGASEQPAVAAAAADSDDDEMEKRLHALRS